MGIAFAVMQTTVMDLIPDERGAEGISFYTLNFILGTAIGPFLGVYISQIATMQTIFIVCTIMTGINVLLSIFTALPKGSITNEQIKIIRYPRKYKHFSPWTGRLMRNPRLSVLLHRVICFRIKILNIIKMVYAS
jgi:predicted MFS family arabinose efflux permease